jgi:hypothetical protein
MGGGRAGSGFEGQRADPGYDVTVARPTFTNLGPRVAIDKAHDNFYTADGRYKPFADLMNNDGFRISRFREKLTSEGLSLCDIRFNSRRQLLCPATTTAVPPSLVHQPKTAKSAGVRQRGLVSAGAGEVTRRTRRAACSRASRCSNRG